MLLRKLTSVVLVIGAVTTLFIGCNTNQTAEKETVVEKEFCPQCPKIAAKQDTVEFVNEVRKFIASKSDLGIVPNERCDTFALIPFENFPVEEYLNYFENDLGVSSCGLAGSNMVKILLENGIDAYTYNFGFRDSDLTHIIVLVKQKGKFLIFDPYMNYEMLDKDGNNMDIITLIEDIASDSLNLTFSQDTIMAEMVVDLSVLGKEYLKMLNVPNCKEYFATGVEIRDSVYKMSFDRCYPCEAYRSCTSFVQRFLVKMRAETKLVYFHEGFALKIHEVLGADDSEEVDDMINTAIYSQPTLGKRLNGDLPN
jgi:hypothetical protein